MRLSGPLLPTHARLDQKPPSPGRYRSLDLSPARTCTGAFYPLYLPALPALWVCWGHMQHAARHHVPSPIPAGRLDDIRTTETKFTTPLSFRHKFKTTVFEAFEFVPVFTGTNRPRSLVSWKHVVKVPTDLTMVEQNHSRQAHAVSRISFRKVLSEFQVVGLR